MRLLCKEGQLAHLPYINKTPITTYHVQLVSNSKQACTPNCLGNLCNHDLCEVDQIDICWEAIAHVCDVVFFF